MNIKMNDKLLQKWKVEIENCMFYLFMKIEWEKLYNVTVNIRHAILAATKAGADPKGVGDEGASPPQIL